jgi:hypothetical protein
VPPEAYAMTTDVVVSPPEQNIAQPDAPLPPRIAAVAEIIAGARARRIRESYAKAEPS